MNLFKKHAQPGPGASPHTSGASAGLPQPGEAMPDSLKPTLTNA